MELRSPHSTLNSCKTIISNKKIIKNYSDQVLHWLKLFIKVQGKAMLVFMTMYMKAIESNLFLFASKASCQLAKENGPYETYEGSPASLGVSSTSSPFPSV